ncbi:hypothetical protein CVT26_010161 [Gymnopilus dilepis]|uniref:Uncharacterized protein n=1 Tax=Gymnopilus dilepis TaxID=231916 RepID=A0A409YRZ9_9AGAR|nr:hypothetical protein CVT26_010161 [Gymnopilus dilepis]
MEPKHSLGDTDYIVERLPSIALRERYKEQETASRENPYLSPSPNPSSASPPSMPVPSTGLLSVEPRHSGSSYEASTYYSAEDNVSSVGGGPHPPMPKMPEHPEPKEEKDTLEAKYRELWLAAQGDNESPPPPPMPVPELAHPYLPSPYDVHREEGEEEGEVDEQGEDVEDDHILHEDEEEERGPAPTMPEPSLPPPPMLMPGGGRPEHRRLGSQGSAFVEHTHSGTFPSRTDTEYSDIPSTAPLRPQKHGRQPRPTGIGPDSPHSQDLSHSGSTSPPMPQPVTQPTPHRDNISQQQSGSPPPFPKPQTPRPSPSPKPSTVSGPPSPQKHSYQHRPPGAAAPTVPPDIVVGKISPPPTQKPASVYPQDPKSNVPVRPPGQPASVLLSGKRTESERPSTTGPSPSPTPSTTHTTSASPPPPSTSPKPAAPHAPATPSPLRQPVTDTPPSKPTPVQPQRANTSVSQAQPTISSSSSRPQIQQQHVPEKPQSQANRPNSTAPQVKPSTSKHTPDVDKEQGIASDAGAIPSRPRLHGSTPSQHTQYVNMLLALDDIPALYNILAGFFTWILLAGFILFPGTFASLQNENATGLPPQVQHELLVTVTRLPLFVVAWVCTGIGVIGMIWLWWRWRKNYIWGVNKIFLPGFLNSLAGLLSTLASLFGAQHGQLTTTSKSTIIVTSAATGSLGILSAFYTFWLIRRVKARHDREVGKERAGKYGEGVVDLSKKR